MLAIEAQGLTRKFGSFTAVDQVDLSVPEGGIFAFLGPNGAGKTTTVKMFSTLLKPTAGTVKLCGVDAWAQPLEARRLMGVVFQDPSLDEELTAEENLHLHADLYHVPRAGLGERIGSMLELVELQDRAKEPVKRFSGGMKRRLEIARALLHEPRLIFLDEPTVGLDPQTRAHLWGYVTRLCKERGITVFVTTHYMEEAERWAKRIAVIDHGRIVAQGSPASLKKAAKAKTLEAAFIKLTGHGIREEEGNAADRMRMAKRIMGRR
jgi:ABC-2 type transport system ATP-binding protein